jgi:hypothetical protein
LSFTQVGIVSGGVTNCGNPDVPDYYVRLDHPEISSFINGVAMDPKGKTNTTKTK